MILAQELIQFVKFGRNGPSSKNLGWEHWTESIYQSGAGGMNPLAASPVPQ